MSCAIKSPLSGIIPPLVTPLIDNDVLDKEGLEKLIEHLIEGGVHALFVLGTTGEAQSLSYKLRVEMIKNTCRIVDGRIPVLVCISDTSIIESVRLSYVAADNGADAVVSAPPYYFAPGQPELAEFYQRLIPQLSLPLFLYNMPSHTKVNFAPSTVRRIAEDSRVIGFKDSSANAVYFQSVMYAMRERPDFAMLVGPEEMTGELVLMGAHGGINGGANMFPRLYVDLYNAAKERNIEKLQQLQEKVMQISSTIYTIGQHASSYLKGLKTSLYLLGICSDFVAAPFHRFEKAEQMKVRKALEELDMDLLLR